MDEVGERNALAALTEADRWLERAVTVQEFQAITTQAALAAELARQANLGKRALNRAMTIKLRAEAGLARAVDAGQADGSIRGHGGGKDPSKIGIPNLTDLGLRADRLREARLIALAADYKPIGAYADAADAADKPLTRSEVIAAGRRIESGIIEGQGDDWYTPAWLFDRLAVTFDLDACAPADPAARSCPARTYCTEADDGLTQPWHGLVWCNPPYSKAAPWAERMIGHGNGILLTHIPHNASWAVDVWRTADAMVPLQALELVRPNGGTYRPGYALTLSGYGDTAARAVARCARITPKAGALWTRA